MKRTIIYFGVLALVSVSHLAWAAQDREKAAKSLEKNYGNVNESSPPKGGQNWKKEKPGKGKAVRKGESSQVKSLKEFQKAKANAQRDGRKDREKTLRDIERAKRKVERAAEKAEKTAK